MTAGVAAAYAATVAGGLVAGLALWQSGTWRGAWALLAFVLAVAGADVATLLWPSVAWTRDVFLAREACAALLVTAYASEVAAFLPRRAAALAGRGLLIVAGVTTAYIVSGWMPAPRAAYRAVALADAGAAAGLAVVLLAALVHEVELSPVNRTALVFLCGYQLVQAASLAPFEWSIPAARLAQFAAAGLYVVAMLSLARAAWARGWSYAP